jgi:hypothetical protein
MAIFGLRGVSNNPYLYLEAASGKSLAVGQVASSGNFVVVPSLTANAVPSGTFVFEIENVANGNINLNPQGSGSAVVNGPANVTGVLTLSASTQGVLQTDAVGVVSSSTGTDGQVLINSTATGVAVWANLTAGTGISILDAAGAITISTAGAGTTWNEETGATASLAVNEGFIANNAGALVTMTLPASASRGDIIRVVGNIAGMGWVIAQNANQYITMGSATTTIGVGGSLASTVNSDAVELLCVDGGASTGWSVISSMGNITVV